MGLAPKQGCGEVGNIISLYQGCTNDMYINKHESKELLYLYIFMMYNFWQIKAEYWYDTHKNLTDIDFPTP